LSSQTKRPLLVWGLDGPVPRTAQRSDRPVAVDVEERATVRIKSLMTPRVLRAVRRLLIRTADVLSQEVRCEDSHEDQ